MPNIKDDLNTINRFLETISWGDELTICQKIGVERAYLIALSSEKNKAFLLEPCHAQNYEAARDKAIILGQLHGVKPGLIIDGACEEARFDYCSHDAYSKGFVLYWLEVHNKLRQSRFLTKALDGIDWSRSIPHAMQGGVSPIYEWDK